MALNLITLAEYKTYAGIKSTNYDKEIVGLIPRVSQFVKNYCGKTFVDYVDTEKVEYFNGGVSKLFLTENPVISINSVGYSQDFGKTYTNLIEYTDWILDNNAICSLNTSAINTLITVNRGFPEVIRGYKVSYLAGYDDVPDDIGLAIMDLVTYYRKNDMSVHSTKAPGTNNVQIEYISTTSLPAHIKRVLDMYRSDYT
jgi:hypothetical protein